MGALDFLSDYFSISTQKKKRKPMQVFMSSCPLCVCVCLWWFVSSKFAFYFPFNSLSCRQLKSRWKWTVMAVKEELEIPLSTWKVSYLCPFIILSYFHTPPRFGHFYSQKWNNKPNYFNLLIVGITNERWIDQGLFSD